MPDGISTRRSWPGAESLVDPSSPCYIMVVRTKEGLIHRVASSPGLIYHRSKAILQWLGHCSTDLARALTWDAEGIWMSKLSCLGFMSFGISRLVGSFSDQAGHLGSSWPERAERPPARYEDSWGDLGSPSGTLKHTFRPPRFAATFYSLPTRALRHTHNRSV